MRRKPGSCTCRGARRASVCKHMVALLLHRIDNPAQPGGQRAGGRWG